MRHKMELTEEEKSKPYAGLMKERLASPSEEALRFLAKRQEMDKKLALLPENQNMEDILKDGYLEGEYGCCTLPGGKGYVAMLNQMPGVTLEMYLFWNQWWSGKEDSTLRYRLWNPKDHYKAGFRWSCEQIGDHIEDLIFLDTLSPKNLGIDPEKAQRSSLLLADGGNVISKQTDAKLFSAPVPGVVCHFVREMKNKEGIELRSRFWKGYQFTDNGLIDAMGPDTPCETLGSLYALAEHNAYEMAHLASILPDLYRMESKKVR